MITLVASKANDCEYCQMHHADAVNHYWKDEEKVEQLNADYQKVNLSDINAALFEYDKKLTAQPNHENEESIRQLKVLGLEDRVILYA